MTKRKKKTIYGYDINTGDPITQWKDRLVHVGNGYYVPLSSITKEDMTRRHKFFATLESELLMKKLGFNEH